MTSTVPVTKLVLWHELATIVTSDNLTRTTYAVDVGVIVVLKVDETVAAESVTVVEPCAVKVGVVSPRQLQAVLTAEDTLPCRQTGVGTGTGGVGAIGMGLNAGGCGCGTGCGTFLFCFTARRRFPAVPAVMTWVE